MKQSIDDLFNKKLSDSKAAFNEAHWDDMAKLLDNEKDRKPKGFWLLLSGTLLLMVLSLGAYWMYNIGEVDSMNVSTNNNQLKTEKNLNNKNDQSLIEIRNKNEQAILNKEEPSITQANESNTHVTSKQNNETGFNRSSTTIQINNQEDRKLVIAKVSDAPSLVPIEAQLNNIKRSDNLGFNSNRQPIFNNNLTSINQHQEVPTKENQISGSFASSSSSSKIINNQSQKTDKPQKEIKTSLPTSREILKSTLINTLSTFLEKDERLYDFPMPTMTKISRKKVAFGLNLYAINYPYFKSNEQFLIGYGIGPTISFPLNNSLSLNTGLNYQNRGGDFDVLKSSEQIEFSFGRNVMTSEILPTSLHYIEWPLSISKRLRKGGISGGIFASYLFNVRGNITKRTEGPNPIIMESITANVVNDGFTIWNFGISAAYERLLTKNLVLETKLKYHLNEITRKDFELINNHLLKENRQLNLQIGLKYYFNK